MLDPDHLRRFMHTFLGYGSWNARLWFAGMEEGGGSDLPEIASRLAAWDGSELMDIREFHRGLEGIDWFGKHPPLQSTWSKLIRVLLCAEGLACNSETVRRHQRDELGSASGRTALIELLPLPAQSMQHWIYDKLWIPELATRATYARRLRNERMLTIRDRIDKYKPAAIVFYGVEYRTEWQEIAKAEFVPSETGRHAVAQRGETRLVMVRHPVARGSRNEEFCAIGRELAGLLNPS